MIQVHCTQNTQDLDMELKESDSSTGMGSSREEEL